MRRADLPLLERTCQGVRGLFSSVEVPSAVRFHESLCAGMGPLGGAERVGYGDLLLDRRIRLCETEGGRSLQESE